MCRKNITFWYQQYQKHFFSNLKLKTIRKSIDLLIACKSPTRNQVLQFKHKLKNVEDIFGEFA